MNDITALAQRMKAAALKADGEQWQTRDGFSGIEVIVKGSLAKGRGCVSYQPVAADLADSKTAKAIALFSPANVLALVEALEKAQRANAAQDDHINQQQDRIDTLEKRNAELGGQLSRYSMSPGQADQRMCESRAARDALGFGKDADNVAPIDLRERIDGMKARIASLESLTVTVKRVGADQMHRVCLEATRHLDKYAAMAREVNKLLGSAVTNTTAAQPVTVKLPPRVDSSNVPFTAHTWNCCLDEVEKRLTAAGIQVIEGEA